MKKILFLSLLLTSIANYSFAQCGAGQVKIKVSINTDPFGSETSWTLKNLMGTTVMQGGQGGVYAGNTSYADSVCVAASGCYFFTIFDTYGDGIFLPGSYNVFVNNALVASGDTNFTSQASATVNCPDSCLLTQNAVVDFKAHINGTTILSAAQLNLVKNTFEQFPECLAKNEPIILLGKSTIADYDATVGPIFTTTTTQNGFSKTAAGFEVQKALIALQQGIFDAVFKPSVYNLYPQHIKNYKYNTCVNFPGSVNAPADSLAIKTALIRANFEDPKGANPYYDINFERMKHALRPTGLYLAPGSVVTVTVPDSLVNKDFYVRVGSHDWDLTERPEYKRLDRISKKFLIDSTTVKVYNPMGGAISILIPYGAKQGNVTVSVKNGVEAPFYSLKSFYETPNFNTEINKPGPWAVFESDNVMYTIPKHSIVAGQFDLKQTLQDWETAVRGVNSILARQIIPDKHNMYMIADLDIRTGVYSIGYPMSNDPLTYTNVPGPAYFINGPGPDDETNFHETGHALAISKFDGEEEALVNVPYIMAMNHGLGETLNEAIKYSFVPNTYTVDKTITHRMVSNSFGGVRDIANSTTNEVRYQHRGYGHYFEIVNLFGWCPLRNFWKQESIDFDNGIDHATNNQNSDRRIVRMSIAAKADLRPLFYVFGIIPQDSIYVQDTLAQLGILPSLTIYNRMQNYINLIPADSASFVAYALSVHPDLFTAGPTAPPDYGVGWHYLKSLTYNTAQAQTRSNILQYIINKYFPTGQPTSNVNTDVCCLLDTMQINLVNNQVAVTGGVAPYNITSTIVGNTSIVKVIDFDGCEAIKQYNITSLPTVEKDAINVYPNPASTEILIDVLASNYTVENVQIFSVQGQVVSNASKTNRIHVATLSEGIYTLQIQLSNGQKTSKKILILR